ncbi:hypothetical protein J28TS4_50710 [Paenibacillus lautus]|nr:hypothetical protein J28TS4_50710 [Paenibacillus lautus]
MNEDLYWWISTPDIGLFSTKFEGAIHGGELLECLRKIYRQEVLLVFSDAGNRRYAELSVAPDD